MNLLIHFLIELKYVAVFIGTFIEGPAVGLLSGLFARTGYFSLPIVYVVHVIADFSADLFYYSLGYFGGHRAVPKIAKFLKISISEEIKDEHQFHQHGRKILLVGKITHVVGFPILIAAGVSRYPISKFVIFDLIATVIKSAGIIALGYFFGNYWSTINNVFSDMTLAGVIIILIPVIYFVFRRRKKDR